MISLIYATHVQLLYYPQYFFFPFHKSIISSSHFMQSHENRTNGPIKLGVFPLDVFSFGYSLSFVFGDQTNINYIFAKNSRDVNFFAHELELFTALAGCNDEEMLRFDNFYHFCKVAHFNKPVKIIQNNNFSIHPIIICKRIISGVNILRERNYHIDQGTHAFEHFKNSSGFTGKGISSDQYALLFQ
ncbi:MAG: hypothetical protein A4E24_01550 [Methanomethylovorans sp. PtaU1.Bin093]|nr:MAG: hypothetical protein A4E24_01550 [Methanomethylovorans sp. PtaU1.Bin093]